MARRSHNRRRGPPSACDMFSAEALGGWCLLRSSKPLSRSVTGRGGFDSHALPPAPAERAPAAAHGKIGGHTRRLASSAWGRFPLSFGMYFRALPAPAERAPAVAHGKVGGHPRRLASSAWGRFPLSFGMYFRALPAPAERAPAVAHEKVGGHPRRLASSAWGRFPQCRSGCASAPCQGHSAGSCGSAWECRRPFSTRASSVWVQTLCGQGSAIAFASAHRAGAHGSAWDGWRARAAPCAKCFGAISFRLSLDLCP